MNKTEDQTIEELAATKNFLTLCIAWLPHGLLRDLIRQVAMDDRDPVAAWETIQERLR